MRESTLEKKRILLVEDHEDAREIIAFNLAEYKLFCASDFEEGLRLARRRYFDLYILDNRLPDRSGVELCRIIRKFDPHTPILFYSADGHVRDLQAAMRAGAQAYFIKPGGLEGLKREITLWISLARETVTEARLEEDAAVREELAVQQKENSYRLNEAKEKCLRAEKKALRARAKLAFLAAGGTRGDFARQWASALSDDAGKRRDP